MMNISSLLTLLRFRHITPLIAAIAVIFRYFTTTLSFHTLDFIHVSPYADMLRFAFYYYAFRHYYYIYAIDVIACHYVLFTYITYAAPYYATPLRC